MRIRGPFIVLTAVCAAVAGVVIAPAASALPPQASPVAAENVRSCGPPIPGQAACHAILHLNGAGPNSATPSGYGPTDLQAAYNLASASSSAGASQIVGIVDAYDDPNAASDVNTYRAHFGLPLLEACNGNPIKSATNAGPCLLKIDQSGGTAMPRKNGGWAQEISLDLDMASAICPHCRILLVEAKSASFADLGAAVNEAAAQGATVISNSYGGSDNSDANYGAYYDHPGVAVTASSGDSGYGVEYPASSQYVTAAGGTTLARATGSTRGWAESAWSGAGSGCSAYNPQPTWQTGVPTLAAVCGRRAVADVSAVADPNTGVAVYDSYAYQGVSGWLVFGGTSVASPIIASVYALAGNASSVTVAAQLPYTHTNSLNDVTTGSNGSCGGSSLCTAGSAWDGPTGLGTPNGTGAF